MIVVDTSSFVTLATADVLPVVLAEYEVHTTETVVAELRETSEYDDAHGRAANAVLEHGDRISVHQVADPRIQSSRIDEGEGSCVALAAEFDAEFLVTDDLRALPELQAAADAKVANSPILLKALVQRGVLGRDEAVDRLDRMAEDRDWLGAPIYGRARRLFEDE